MSKREAKLLVEDIVECGNKILEYTKDLSFEVFLNDPKTVDAVIRNFEIIGEAASRLPEDFKLTHPEIEWARLKGLRNRIVHDYFGIDLSIIWNIRTVFLPPLISRLELLIC
jgi:uncharacterized protein with HEPN domain